MRPPGAAKTHNDSVLHALPNGTRWRRRRRPAGLATVGHFTGERPSKKRDGSQLAPSLEAVVVVLVFLFTVYPPRLDVPATRPLAAARGAPIVVASLFGRVARDPRCCPVPTTPVRVCVLLDVHWASLLHVCRRHRSRLSPLPKCGADLYRLWRRCRRRRSRVFNCTSQVHSCRFNPHHPESRVPRSFL